MLGLTKSKNFIKIGLMENKNLLRIKKLSKAEKSKRAKKALEDISIESMRALFMRYHRDERFQNGSNELNAWQTDTDDSQPF